MIVIKPLGKQILSVDEKNDRDVSIKHIGVNNFAEHKAGYFHFSSLELPVFVFYIELVGSNEINHRGKLVLIDDRLPFGSFWFLASDVKKFKIVLFNVNSGGASTSSSLTASQNIFIGGDEIIRRYSVYVLKEVWKVCNSNLFGVVF